MPWDSGSYRYRFTRLGRIAWSVIAALITCSSTYFFLELWIVILPQIWGKISVHTFIPNALLRLSAFSISVFYFNGFLFRRFRNTSWRQQSALIFASVFSVIFTAKFLLGIMEARSIQKGVTINRFVELVVLRAGELPSGKEIVGKLPGVNLKDFKITEGADGLGWVLTMKSRVFPWWSLSCVDGREWFYQVD